MGRLPLVGPALGIGGAVGILLVATLDLSPMVAVEMMIAVPLAYAALLEPVIALVLLQCIVWSNLSGVVGSRDGVSLYVLALGLATVSLVMGRRRSKERLFRSSPMYPLLATTTAAAGLSLLVTRYPVASLSIPEQRLKDVAFFFVSLGLMRLTGRYRTAVAAMVLTVGLMCGLTVVQQYILHNHTTFAGLSTLPKSLGVATATVRHAGPEGDPNFWGRTILLAVAAGIGLTLMSWRRRRRIGGVAAWLVVVGALAVGEYLTQSRGDLIAMFALVGCWLLVAGRRHGRYLLLVPAVIVIVLLAVPGLSPRLGTLSELTHIQQASTDPSLVGRVQALEVGIDMFAANPVSGVGFGNFEAVEPRFLARPGQVDTGEILAPHNVYLELAAEQGLVGLAAWMLFFGGAMVIALRAAGRATRVGDSEAALIAFGSFVGLLAWAVASVMLHISDFNDLLAVVAVATAVDIEMGDIAGRQAQVIAEPRMVGDPHALRSRIVAVGSGVGMLAVGAAVVGGSLLVLPTSRTEYQATAAVEVRPVTNLDGYDVAYAWSTVDRELLLPSLAMVISSPRFGRAAEDSLQLSAAEQRDIRITASGDVFSALVVLSVRSPDSGVAEGVVTRTVTAAEKYLRSMISEYQLEPVTTSTLVAERVLRPRVVVVDGALFLAVVTGCRATRRRRIASRSVPVTY